jgi:acyl carrier protein
LYKSGDLARHRPGGSIEFLGRLDHQAKIRGFRIEPGEIESTLRRHPKIQDALTLAREEIPGDKRLVAYIIAGQGEPPRADELRDFLKQTLPDYMVPAAFVFLDALPLTANGKVDRKALPAPEVSGPEAPDSWLAPRNAVEEILAAIWAKLFNRNAIGVCDNFFDLGGHSLLATQLVSRVRKRLSLELPVRAVFENPTLAQLSAYIAALEAKNDGAAEALPDTAPGTEDVIL